MSAVLTATRMAGVDGGPGERIEWLDFLRGVSALAVVLFHARVPLWLGWREVTTGTGYSAVDYALAWLSLPFPFFGTAVMLFFVVSGFAIHYPHAGGRATFEAAPYAARRFLRIYPAYLAAVLLTVASEWCVQALTGAEASNGSLVLASIGMAQNYHPGTQMHANPSLWSLPVEMELYLAYPLLLWVWLRWGMRAAVMLAAVASIGGVTALALGHAWPMGNFAKYWIIWTAGAVLAERVRSGAALQWRRGYTIAMVGGLAVAVAARAGGLPFGYEHFLWGALYVLILMWGLSRPSPLARLHPAVRRTGQFLGNISYSLYLVHFPVLAVAGAWWVATYGDKPASFLVPVTASLLPIPLAYLVWRFVEQPSQALGRSIAQRRRSPGGQPAPAPQLS